MKRIALLILFAAIPMYGADDCHVLCIAKREAVRYVRDAKSLATAPLHWDEKQWARFGEGSAAGFFFFAVRALNLTSSQIIGSFRVRMLFSAVIDKDYSRRARCIQPAQDFDLNLGFLPGFFFYIQRNGKYFKALVPVFLI